MHLRRLELHEVALYAEVLVRPFAYWEELTRSVTEPGPHVMFLAHAGNVIVGST